MIRVEIIAPREPLLDRAKDLSRLLQRRGATVGLRHASDDAPAPGLRLLVLFERILFGAADDGAGPAVGPLDDADLVIDLSSAAPETAEKLTLFPLFDGLAGEFGLASALLERRAPVVDIMLVEPGATPRRVAEGTPALENRERFILSYRAVAATTAALLSDVVARRDRGEALALDDEPPLRRAATRNSALGFAAMTLAQKVSRRLTDLAIRREHFRVGWRRVGAEPSVTQTFSWPEADYAFIKDASDRFFADPFIFAQRDRRFIFCEEFPYATGKGILSVVELFDNDVVSPPQPVLEREVHLSYPQIFERDGAIWMIPETSGAKRIELYRAERFPHSWRHEATLVDGVRAADATLIERGGRLWLLATVAEDGLSDWAALNVYVAEQLLGPWRAHPGNPVLIDAAAGRPAGPVFSRNGELWRPAQDCSQGYGGGLTFCRIDQLDEQNYRQTPLARLAPEPRWRARGTHHIHHAAGIEAIDIVGWRRRERRAN